MTKYHITITDNETGKVYVDLDTDCIIGAYSVEGGAKTSVYTSCDGGTLLTSLCAAKRAITATVEDEPGLQRLLKLIDLAEQLGFDPSEIEHDETDTDN